MPKSSTVTALVTTSLLMFLSFGTCHAFEDSTLPASARQPASFAARHVNILQLEQFVRYNYMDKAPGVVAARDMQYRVRLRSQFNLVGKDTTFLRLRAETGQGFSNSWNNTGAGLGSGQTTFLVKAFSLGQRIGPFVELHAGGLDFDSGAGTQRTYASGDGALTGYRGIVKLSRDPEKSNKFSLTLGNVGDLNQANFFQRAQMGTISYGQALVQKQFGKNATASAELNSIRKVWFTRGAINVDKGFGKILDAATLEAIVRTNNGPRVGWSAALSRHLDSDRRWTATVIYTDIPRLLYDKQGQTLLANQGEISSGKRLSWASSYAITRNARLEVFGGRRLDNTPSLRWTAQGGISYQYGSFLNHLLGR